MSRSVIALIVVLVVLVGGLFFLAGRETKKEPVRMEKVVPLDNLAN
jgi:preprotein translocase subunit YajC